LQREVAVTLTSAAEGLQGFFLNR
jgi:staphylococcal nuclease domain-containing protein 1